MILIFRALNDASVISSLFRAAGYTYGPLLGLFTFGMFNRLSIKDKWVPLVCLVCPLISYILNINSKDWWGYEFGFEILILNGLSMAIMWATLK